MEGYFFRNFGFIISKIPEDLLNSIKEECVNAKDIWETGISGHNVPIHFKVKNKNLIEKFILDLVLIYEKNYGKHYDTEDNLNINRLAIGPCWINNHFKNEIIPLHDHQGIYSFVFWIELPKNIKDKQGNFQFVYTNVLGQICKHSILLNKDYEGKVILFPSKLNHQVLPFNSEEKRVSIAGNVHNN